MLNLPGLKIIYENYLILFLFALLINITITFLRTSRLRSFIKIKNLKNLLFFLSFYRVANFILPLKSADIIQVFFFKKILVKNNFLNVLSLLTLTKILDMFLVQLISLFVLIFFILDDPYNLAFLVIMIFILILIYKKKTNIKEIFKLLKYKLRNLKKPKNLLVKIYTEIDYILRSELLKKSILISILNYLFILIMIFLSTDQTFDKEIFFLIFIFSILQPLPIKLFFGVGFFDLAVYISNIYFGIGIEIQQLVFFRLLSFTILVMEFFAISIIYVMSSLNTRIQKNKKK